MEYKADDHCGYSPRDTNITIIFLALDRLCLGIIALERIAGK